MPREVASPPGCRLHHRGHDYSQVSLLPDVALRLDENGKNKWLMIRNTHGSLNCCTGKCSWLSWACAELRFASIPTLSQLARDRQGGCQSAFLEFDCYKCHLRPSSYTPSAIFLTGSLNMDSKYSVSYCSSNDKLHQCRSKCGIMSWDGFVHPSVVEDDVISYIVK